MGKIPASQVIVIVCLFLAFVGLGVGGPANPDASKRDVMAKHLVFFRDAYKQYQSPDKNVHVLLEKLATDAPFSAKDWESLLATLVEDSVWGLLPGNTLPSGFVQQEQVVDVLVAALHDANAGERRYVAAVLTWQVNGKMREKYAGDIQMAMGYGPHLCQNPDMLALFAKCGLTPGQKTEIRTWERIPEMVRALCGDEAAEAALISAFEKSADWQEKRMLARQLAYVGTGKCVEALIAGLCSPVFRDGIADQYSIRTKVLRALGLIYEDEALFTTEAFALDTHYDDVFDRKYGLKRYTEAVDRWVQEKFGRSAWGDGEIWFRRLK